MRGNLYYLQILFLALLEVCCESPVDVAAISYETKVTHEDATIQDLRSTAARSKDHHQTQPFPSSSRKSQDLHIGEVELGVDENVADIKTRSQRQVIQSGVPNGPKSSKKKKSRKSNLKDEGGNKTTISKVSDIKPSALPLPGTSSEIIVPSDIQARMSVEEDISAAVELDADPSPLSMNLDVLRQQKLDSNLIVGKAEDIFSNNPIPLPPPMSTMSRKKEQRSKNRYILRLKEQFVKNVTDPEAKSDEKEVLVREAGHQLDLIFSRFVQNIGEDGNFYFENSREAEINKEMEMMFYELVRDPSSYYQNITLDAEEILAMLGGVNKSLSMLLAENPINSTTVKWYIDQVFQRLFGPKIINLVSSEGSGPTSISEESVDQPSLISTLMNSTIAELLQKIASLVAEIKQMMYIMPAQSYPTNHDVSSIVQKVAQITTAISTLESRLTVDMKNLNAKLTDTFMEFTNFSSGISDLNSMSKDNRWTLNNLFGSVNTIHNIIQPLSQKVDSLHSTHSSRGDKHGLDVDQLLKNLTHAFSQSQAKSLSDEYDSIKNITTGLLVSLGKFTKKELDELKTESQTLHNLIENTIITSFTQNTDMFHSFEKVFLENLQGVWKKLTETKEQVDKFEKNIGKIEESLAAMHTDSKNKDNNQLASLTQKLNSMNGVINTIFTRFTNLSATLNSKIEGTSKKSNELHIDIKSMLEKVLGVKVAMDSYRKEGLTKLENLSTMVTSNSEEWRSRFDQVLFSLSTVSKSSESMVDELRTNYRNFTESLIAGFQFGAVSAAMQHQLLSEMNKTLIGVDNKIENFLEGSHLGFMNIVKIIAETYKPSAKEGVECESTTGLSDVMSNMMSKIETALDRSKCVDNNMNVVRPKGRSDSNMTQLEEEDIRYNFEDLIWVLKSCHIGDRALCEYAWCAKVCGFKCPFNCKQYVSCFYKYQGDKALVRDCYAGLDEAFLRNPAKEISMKIQCTDSLLQGREVGINLAAFESSGGNFFKKHISSCNISSVGSSVSNATMIKGYTILVSSCMKCKEYMENWDGSNVTRLIDYINANCTDKHQCNGMTAVPTKICCTEYPCAGKDKESCCDKSCLSHYKGMGGCYKPKILVSSPYVRSHDLTSGSGTMIGSLFVGNSVDVSVTFPDRCIVPGFQMIVAGMTQLPKGSKHPGQKTMDI